MPKTRKQPDGPPGTRANANPRVRWRNQGGELRAYADLRDLGGGRVALIPPNEHFGTTDPEIAEELISELIAKLKQERKDQILLGLDPNANLAEFCIHHLEARAREAEQELDDDNLERPESWVDRWQAITEKYLERAVTFFCRVQFATDENPDPEPRPRNLKTISVEDVEAFVEWLKEQPSGRRGRVLGKGSRRHHLSALSSVFKRAIGEGKLKQGSNPVAGLMRKPKAPPSKTPWLEIDELALVLESARVLAAEKPAAGGRAVLHCAYELIATFILTGAREDEIRRLRVEHLDFDADLIDIPGTKTELSNRAMPMHPQLREILFPYVHRLEGSRGLLFTTAATKPIGDWRKTLDAVAVRAGFQKGSIRTRMFRTSYITHRLACIDSGAPIEPYKVAREVGHSDLAMIMKVYGRVQRRRVRLQEFAFRTDAIGAVLQPRLRAIYAPPPRARTGAHEHTELYRQFHEATAGLTVQDVVAATGIPKATVKRLRAGGFQTLQGRTRARILSYLGLAENDADLHTAKGSTAALPVPERLKTLKDDELVRRLLERTAGLSAQEVTAFTGISIASFNRLRSGRFGTLQPKTRARIDASLAEADQAPMDKGHTRVLAKALGNSCR
jgi:integrase